MGEVTAPVMPYQPKILVAADDRAIRMMLETGLTLNGFRVTGVRTGREAQIAASSGGYDAVLSDICMPDGGGLDLVDALRASDPNLPIVLMTAKASLQAAVDAVARGASDFIGKPFQIGAVVALLRRYVDARREIAEPETNDENTADFSGSGLVGRSAAMAKVYKLVAQAARSNATVLVTGESGTGKELVARAIHDFSERKSRPFLSVNCSGMTETLLESELFGHTRGAFTGAERDHSGLFEAAEGGTLFLDELASTSPAFQASLLRVLQSGEVRRVGSTQSRRVNVRVIGASNAPLRRLVADGAFRADLYYRLSVLGKEQEAWWPFQKFHGRSPFSSIRRRSSIHRQASLPARPAESLPNVPVRRDSDNDRPKRLHHSQGPAEALPRPIAPESPLRRRFPRKPLAVAPD